MTKHLYSSSSGTCSTKRRSRFASNRRLSRRRPKTRPSRSPRRRETIGQPTVQLRPGPLRGKQRRKTWSESLKMMAIRPWRMLPSSQSLAIRSLAVPVMIRHRWATTRIMMDPPSREPLVMSSLANRAPRPAFEGDKRLLRRQLGPPLLGEVYHLQINRAILSLHEMRKQNLMTSYDATQRRFWNSRLAGRES